MKIVKCKKGLFAAFCLLCGGAFSVSALHFPIEEQTSPHFNAEPPNLAHTISWTNNRPPQVRFSQNISSQREENPQHPDIEVQLRVYPERTRSVLSQVMLASEANFPASQAYIKLDIYGDLDLVRIRLVARHADGTPAGQINGPGKNDDIVYWKSSDNSYIPFRSDSKPGKAFVWAELLDSNGKVIATSARQEILFVLPEIKVTYGDWKASAKAATWERRIYIKAEFQALGMLDFTGTPVLLKIKPVPDVGAIPQVSWLANNKGRTVREQAWGLGPNSASMPYTTTQYWRETPTGTRQLNTYRVHAIVDRTRLFALPPHPSSVGKTTSPKKESA